MHLRQQQRQQRQGHSFTSIGQADSGAFRGNHTAKNSCGETAYQVVSLNVNKRSWEDFSEADLPLILERFEQQRLVIMVQEVASWPVNPFLEGFVVFHMEGKKTAILITVDLNGGVRMFDATDDHSYIVHEVTRFLNSYFPISHYGLEYYETAVFDAERILQDNAIWGIIADAWAGDFQVALPKEVADRTGDGIVEKEIRGC